MSLTRRLLKELELTDAAIERVIAAHTATVEALKQERDAALSDAEESARKELDAARQEAAATLAELTAYRAQVEAARMHEARRAALSEALEKHGVNPAALPLMLDAVSIPEEEWDGDALLHADAVVHALQEKYGPLFARRTPLPVQKVEPPVASGGALTHQDVMRMSPEDINRNWSAVQTALTHCKH